jgi:hypothetical protein
VAHPGAAPIHRKFKGGSGFSAACGGTYSPAAASDVDFAAHSAHNLVCWPFSGPNAPMSNRLAPISLFDRWSDKGAGGSLRVAPDPIVAEEAREKTVAFFMRAFRH